jgi:hypothetical protein
MGQLRDRMVQDPEAHGLQPSDRSNLPALDGFVRAPFHALADRDG